MKAVCTYFGISRQAYYAGRECAERETLREAIVLELVDEVRRQMPRIGCRKLHHLLRDDLQRLGVGRDRLFAVLRKHGRLVMPLRSGARTTQSYHRFRKGSHLVRGVARTRPDQAWAADITYIRTEGDFVYLFLLTDMYSRKIVGWALRESLKMEGAREALRMALRGRRDGALPLIHHSDRGIQYCCDGYVAALQGAGVQISMTEENPCNENGLAERVNGILKQEFLLGSTFRDYAQALRAAKSAIAIYNERRPHCSLGMRRPAEVHAEQAA